ncbi:uncharacterized protein BCR38DRAFT_466019 [Pseudomassariella vexata]|uniref:ZIP zinc transporter-domain-containing protein n=1 Tax=Pseudomassariella vexata TaxID=1141098 RepID=A0A1Y2DXK0_9PEZI|nr:uncharacterized protein BCR38DRAFT_466019 [Pseudomassariella vexata]ORY63939.1 hypothetical protein BCR38DRAFT_466019 [Pseudomassariella vexata]
MKTAGYMPPAVVRRQTVPTTSAPQIGTTATPTATSITAISECHEHGTEVFCMFGTTEYQVVVPATATSSLPASYTDCHNHGSELFCVGPDGGDVEVITDTTEETQDDSSASGTETTDEEEGQDCHFHAGVEHCVGTEEESAEVDCSRQDRDYNIPLRVGLLFVILVTSFIGVAGPILLAPVLPVRFSVVFLVLKQFGTGVIISTAFVHLYTHATLMFTNECLQGVEYESTTSAILMAGLFLSFLVDYLGHRLAKRYTKTSGPGNNELISVLVLEAGIIFHSLLIGLTLVVAGDSFFVTLFIVILFHQMFEGIALGARIASIGHPPHNVTKTSHAHTQVSPNDDKSADSTEVAPQLSEANSSDEEVKRVSVVHKVLMASAFALITPIGMAIGIGVLQKFNGNDPATLIALGTLDALSAGILVWVGVVEMWARDWMFGGELVDSGAVVTTCAGVGLIAGMALMSFLGKWA